MNRNYKTSSLTEAAMITGILVIIAYISNFMTLAMFFYPTPAIVLAKRKGLNYAIMALFASDIITGMLLGVQTGLIFFVQYTPLAIALAYGISRDEEANKTILYGAAAYMVSFVVLIYLADLIMGVNFIKQMSQIYDESFNIMQGFTNYSEEMLKSFETARSTMMFIINNVLPAIVIVSSVITSYANYIVVSLFAKRFSIDIKQHEGLTVFSFPRTFMIAMSVLLMLSYAFSLFKINISIIQMNLFFIIYMAMFLQGFAVIKFFVHQASFSVSTKRIVMLMLLMLSLSAALAVVMLGVADMIIDIRRLRSI